MDLKTLTHLPTLFKTSERVINEHAPAILTALGVVGTVSTAVLTAKASFKAAERLREAKLEKSYEHEGPITDPTDVALTKRETIEKVWTLYMPAVGVGMLSCGAIIGANHINAKRIAVMTAAYSLGEKNFTEYKEKVEEKLGIKKEQEMRDEIAQDRVNQLGADGFAFADPTFGKVWIMEAYTGRPFLSTVEEVKRAANEINSRIIDEKSARLSDFYDLIKLPHVSTSDYFGFTKADPLQLDWTTTTSPDGSLAVHVFEYHKHPVANPEREASFL